MESHPDFSNLWQNQPATIPDSQTLLAKAKKMKRSQLQHILISNLLLGLTSLFIIWIWINFDPVMVTTKFGIIMIIIAMGIFVVLQGQLRPLLNKLDESQSAKVYMDGLLEVKRKQQFLSTTALNLYFIMLSAGVGLYMIEYTMMMPLCGALLAYSLTAIWIAFNWFYIRPRTIRKQQNKIDELLNQFRTIRDQFKV